VNAIGPNHIQVAASVLARIAMSGGEGADAEARLAYWRETEGIDGVEVWAAESTDETIDEIREMIEESGAFSLERFAEFLMRDSMAGFQIGWIAARRYEKRLRDGKAQEVEEPSAGG
jgi:hypothetical protein